MKTVEELKRQEPVFLNAWSELYDVVRDFVGVYMDKKEFEAETNPFSPWMFSRWSKDKKIVKKALEELKGVNILFASSGSAYYEGDAWVLFERKGILYEVVAWHCSYLGLEGKWEPEEVDRLELEYRLTESICGKEEWPGNKFKVELKEFLGI